MKRFIFLILVLSLTSFACSFGATEEAPTLPDEPPVEMQPADESEPLPTNDANCYAEGEHPIAVSIADQFSELTMHLLRSS